MHGKYKKHKLKRKKEKKPIYSIGLKINVD
jgi:hypothetical protein